jgi:exosortase A-associated hydrolase 2
VLVAPPFAEEMNKSRKMLADVGRALCGHGIATILVDLYGTGDSEGEFREATWARWIDDLARAAEWAAAEGWSVEGLLGVRLGCILGAEAARAAIGSISRTVFWQPVADGERFLAQFLRLRVAASMMEGPRESVGELRQMLHEGTSVEVAGYELGPELAEALSGLSLADSLGTQLGALHWMEVVRDREAPVPTGSQALIDTARSRGLDVHAHTCVGDPFWTSTEIVRIPELVDLTVAALAADAPEQHGRAREYRSESRP